MENLHLTIEELTTLQTLNKEFSDIKVALGDLEIQKFNLLNKIEVIRENFSKHELELISKYGQDSVVNLQTGEVTKKQD